MVFLLSFLHGKNEREKKLQKPSSPCRLILIAILFIVAFNLYQTRNMKVNDTGNLNIAGNTVSEVKYSNLDVIPKGAPQIYGKELNVKFDDVSGSNPQQADNTIRRLGVLDQQTSLSGKQLSRYISIVSKMSCEYCCGTESIIFNDGQPACGCAHSFAMRGLAKYLIKNHENEFTDDQILEELGKWKTLFFPSQITKKAGVLKSKGIELTYINLASNKYRDIEKGATSTSSGMVGGC